MGKGKKVPLRLFCEKKHDTKSLGAGQLFNLTKPKPSLLSFKGTQFIALRLIKSPELPRIQVMISNPSTSSILHHASSHKEKSPKTFQRTTLGLPPSFPMLHHLVRVAGSSHKNLQAAFLQPA